MQYITDLIGDEYRNWEIGENILISSPTGSGKSTFVLKKLLPHAIENGKYVVYLCNRKILNAQFTETTEKELETLFATDGGIPENMRHAILIVTYQYCEISKQFPCFSIKPDLSHYSKEELVSMQFKHCVPPPREVNASDIMYYVFDEAHYFLADSSFNPEANYWFRKNFNNHCINVFLTATPEPFLTFMASRERSFHLEEHIEMIQCLYNEKGQLRRELERELVPIKSP